MSLHADELSLGELAPEEETCSRHGVGRSSSRCSRCSRWVRRYRAEYCRVDLVMI
jgi:hypothetical protein